MLLASESSGAKIILTGEHAVVYNYKAIALPFNGVKTTVNIYQTNKEITIKSKFHSGLLKDGSETILGLQQLVYYLLDKFNVKPFGLHIEVESNIESRCGMGSSAALSVAATKALFKAFNQELTDWQLIECSLYAERFFHKNPSGLDVHTIVKQKPIVYYKNGNYEYLNINLKAYLVIIDTLLSSQTRDAVMRVANLKVEHPKTINQILKAIGVLSDKAEKALKTNELTSLQTILKTNQKYLRMLGVSNSTIDKTIAKAKKLGLKGLKLTGGGMGGCVIGLTNDLEVIETIKSSFESVWIDNLGEKYES